MTRHYSSKKWGRCEKCKGITDLHELELNGRLCKVCA